MLDELIGILPSDEVEVEDSRGDAMSRLYVLRADTLALTVERSPKKYNFLTLAFK